MTILKSHGVIIPLQQDCGTCFLVFIVIRKSTTWKSWKSAVGIYVQKSECSKCGLVESVCIFFFLLSVHHLFSFLISWHAETKMLLHVRSKIHWNIRNFKLGFCSSPVASTTFVLYHYIYISQRSTHGLMVNVVPTSLYSALPLCLTVANKNKFVGLEDLLFKTPYVHIWHWDTNIECSITITFLTTT